MDDLKTFLGALANEDERKAFAVRCGTTIKHMRNVMYGTRLCSEKLAASLERESRGMVKVEASCAKPDGGKWRRIPDAKWPWHPQGRPLLDLTEAA